MNLKLIGSGIFMWAATERRTNRYGKFYLGSSNFNDDAIVKVVLKKKELTKYVGQRVRIVCKVIEARQSGHIGDLFLGISPSQPEVGEEIELGTGTFYHNELDYDAKLTEMSLAPGDNREELWIDPRKLYRLHDQTVELYIEKTDDDFHSVPNLKCAEADAFGTGSGIQIKSRDDISDGKMKAMPTIKPFGRGCFVVSPPDFSHGKLVKLIKE